MQLILPTLVLAMTVAANQVVLQGDPRSSNLLPDSFPTFVKALMNEWHVPGLSLGVIKVPEDGGDVVTEFHGFGEAGHGRKVDKDVRSPLLARNGRRRAR